MNEAEELHKDQVREKKHWRNMIDNRFVVSPAIIWFIGIVFAIGGAYTLIARIPSLERKQETQALQINTLEVNYTSIEKWMQKIDAKLEKINNAR